MILNVLLTIYATLTVLDTLFMLTLHIFHDRKGYYKTAALLWFGVFLSFSVDGFISAQGWGTHELFGIPFIAITMFSFAKLAADIYGFTMPYRALLTYCASCWIVGCVLRLGFGAPFVVSAFIIITGVVAPAAVGAWKFFAVHRQSKKKMNVIDRFFGLLMIAEVVHFMDYPFLRNIEEAAVFGFSFALVLVYFASMLIPVVINRRLSADLTVALTEAVATAERSNQAKSVFLANMSHELRTPMHGILSYARFGQQKIDTVPKEKLKFYFDEIYASGSRLMSFLNDILDLSKLEAGKVQYEMAPHYLRDVIEHVMQESVAFVRERELSLDVVLPRQPESCVFDSGKITQVLRNLLNNAIKFSTNGTVIRIEVATEEAGFVRCTVANRGVGIPEDELGKIFDKFVQSSKTRTGAGGTGLGLAICKEIVEQHGGKIWAENDVSGDVCFYFTLPIHEVKMSA